MTYEDGAPQTIDQYAKDVTAFMMWVAEPHLESRKRIGLGVVAFLLVFVGAALFHQAQDLVGRAALGGALAAAPDARRRECRERRRPVARSTRPCRDARRIT